MSKLSETVDGLIDKYELSAIAEAVSVAKSSSKVSIGFVGRYSSGKSSLINRLYGCQLPVATKPTTKCICMIESSSSVSKPTYFADDGVSRSEIDIFDFNSIVNGDIAADAALLLPLSSALPEDVVIVDTPGIDSMSPEDKERTYAYLQNLDAAIVCIPVVDGTLQENIRQFILDPRFANVRDRLLFAVTRSDDKKNPVAVETVRTEIICQLKRLVADGKIALENIDDRVIAVSHEMPLENFRSRIDDLILVERIRMRDDRLGIKLAQIGKEVLNALLQRKNTLSYDASGIEKEMVVLKAKREELESLITTKREELEGLEAQLAAEIAQCMRSYQKRISSTSSTDERDSAIAELETLLKNLVDAFVVKHKVEFSVDTSVFGDFGNQVADVFHGIQQTRDQLVGVADVIASVAISIATAGVGAGVAAGAAAKETGKTMAKRSAKSVGKAAAKAAAKNATQKAAENAAKIGFLQKVMPYVSEVFKAVDPFEWIGDMVASNRKTASFDDLVKGNAGLMAMRVIAEMARPFEEQLILPLKREIAEAENGLNQLRGRRNADIETFRAFAASLDADIALLESQLN